MNTYNIGDTVTILWTGNDEIDQYAGQNGTITAVLCDGHMYQVRTNDGTKLVTGRLEVSDAWRKRR